ncbi:MAG: alpha/beta hydrolase [Solirubrobacterales bacterium]|nr:alpha/beta hydrolase [Solirubrobacterales bacterium]
MAEHVIERAGVTLDGEAHGEGIPVVLLHGLTATRRYVVMGSKALERSGHHVVSYDARGHGRSSPAPDPSAYTYQELLLDALAVLDAFGFRRAVLAGASMGAHTLLALALHAPERVAGLVVITPAYEPEENENPGRLAHWDALSEALRNGGVEGFLAASDLDSLPADWQDTVARVIRQRMSAHEHPEAVADALSAVPRSRPFQKLEQLAEIKVPVAVVASADEPDPAHPQAVGEAYADAIPGAQLILDQPGRSPIAWQGSQLSKIIAEVAAQAKLA